MVSIPDTLLLLGTLSSRSGVLPGGTGWGSTTGAIASPRVTASDAVLDLLAPLWQLIIGCCVVLTIAVATVRLARRGPSRMGAALLFVGAVILAVSVLGVLAS